MAAVHRRVTYKLYPSASQAVEMERVCDLHRALYNAALQERIDAWRLGRVSIGFAAQCKSITQIRRDDPAYLGLNAQSLQVTLKRLDLAFGHFFRRVKAGETPGYPRFKGRNRFPGFGFKEFGNGFKIDGRRLKLTGIGRIAVRWHRAIEGKIKTARVFCRAGKWFVAFSCEVEEPEPLPAAGESIGIDVGLHRLATLSNGEEIDNPRWYRRVLRKLRVVQRSISRKRL